MTARGVKVDCICAECQKPFVARVADRKRGWARFCSKRCKAREQERRIGANYAYRARVESRANETADYWSEVGWDGHKCWFGDGA